mgnify:CR=1 FL=1
MSTIKIENTKMLYLKYNGIVKKGFIVIKLVEITKYIKMSRWSLRKNVKQKNDIELRMINLFYPK